MPTYVYRCEACAAQFEVIQSFHDEPLSICPECGQATVHRVITPVGIIFKGPGFYVTDNRRPSAGGKRNGASRGTEKKREEKTGEATKDGD